jgi:hypothetical protein
VCTAVQTAAVQYCYIIISIQNAKVQTVCTAVQTAAVQYCYIIISIQNAKVQTVCTAVRTAAFLDCSVILGGFVIDKPFKLDLHEPLYNVQF